MVGVTAADALSLDIIGRGAGFVAVNWEGTKMVSVYSSPDGTMEDLESLLREVGALVVGLSPSPTIVVGDLNTKSGK